MKYRLLSLLALLLAAGPLRAQPNVLWIILDDLNMEIGAYGHPYVRTPHIDRLAAEGVRFDRAYVQQPICAASRSSMFTGLRPATTGVDYPYSYYFVAEILPRYGTIARRFMQNGYYARDFGKIQHGMRDSLSAPTYWPPGDRYVVPENVEVLRREGYATLPPFERADLPDSLYQDARTGAAVVEALREAARQENPFFFEVGFLKPHIPFTAPERFWALYDPDRLPLAENPFRPSGAPGLAYDRYNLRQYTWQHADPERLFTSGYARTLRQGYFASISLVDDQIGRILDELDRLGLRRNTIVVFTSDHGFHLGEVNHWGKATLFEESLRSPLIVSAPGVAGGKASEALVEYVDIVPTLLDLAGLAVPDYLEGVSMAPLLRNPDQPWKQAVFSRQPRGVLGAEIRGRSMRTRRYRYTEWRTEPADSLLAVELYDLQADPAERVNLAVAPDYDELRDVLSGQLAAGWKAALPPGVVATANHPAAPPPYPWSREGVGGRAAWHQLFGGTEAEGWRAARQRRSDYEARRQ